MLDRKHRAEEGACIKVIGVGGGGGNAVNHMAQHNIEGVEFICANTDAQALMNSRANKTIQIGVGATKGLGAGTSPEVGRNAALEDREAIEHALLGTDMLFITTGMGGGTGTGATPIIAEIAKEMGILTVAVVTRPFPFEGKRRMRQADEGIRALTESVDSLITIPNEKLLTMLGKDANMLAAFAKADDVLCGAVRGISDIIKRPGLINVDFADVRAVMSQMGMAVMGTGIARGENRAREATQLAVHNPLLDGADLRGARGILVNITVGEDVRMDELSDVGDIINEFASEDAIVKVGTVIDSSLGDEFQVTVVATGLEMHKVEAQPQQAEPERGQAHLRHQPTQMHNGHGNHQGREPLPNRGFNHQGRSDSEHRSNFDDRRNMHDNRGVQDQRRQDYGNRGEQRLQAVAFTDNRYGNGHHDSREAHHRDNTALRQTSDVHARDLGRGTPQYREDHAASGDQGAAVDYLDIPAFLRRGGHQE